MYKVIDLMLLSLALAAVLGLSGAVKSFNEAMARDNAVRVKLLNPSKHYITNNLSKLP